MTEVDRVGPVDHITRAVLPWRSTADLTECGKDVADFPGRLVTREEASARIKRIGQRRSMFSLCMTCVSTSDRYRSRWAPTEDIVTAVARAASSVQNACPPRAGQDPSPLWRERERLAVEFDAILALVSAHREEFEGYLAGREQTVSLADRRRRRRG